MASKLRLPSGYLVKGLILVLSFSLSAQEMSAQKRNKPPKDPQKEAIKKEEAKAKSLDRDIKKLKKEFRKSQDKSTRKRMKSNKARSRRKAENKKDPWLSRIFRKRDYKKVKKGKDG
jgi:hypothetical protein